MKGQSTAEVKLTPQQMQDALRARLQTHGRLRIKIANPHAADSNIISMLQSQRQAAENERQEIAKRQITPADGSRPAGSSSNVINTGHGVPPSAPGKGTAPVLPKGLALTPPCVQSTLTVTGQASGVMFTPIAAWNLYTIQGCGFGNKPGNIYLEGPFTGGRVPLQVSLSPERGQSNWSDRAIIASLDPQLKGETDHDNITLVIEPVGGSPIRKSGFKFYAARETLLLLSIPENVTRLAGSASSKSPGGKVVAGQEYLGYYSPSQQTPGMSADVFRSVLNGALPPGRSDYFDFSTLSKGFQTDSFQLETYESDLDGTCGYDATEPNWNTQWDGGNIRVTFKVCGCSQGFGEAGWGGYGSFYSLNVWVTGPRGVDPWSSVRGVKTLGQGKKQ
jgi:hypothetical protein